VRSLAAMSGWLGLLERRPTWETDLAGPRVNDRVRRITGELSNRLPVRPEGRKPAFAREDLYDVCGKEHVAVPKQVERRSRLLHPAPYPFAEASLETILRHTYSIGTCGRYLSL
jgi:hypothetical protein